MNNGTTTQAYIIANGKRVELESASNDELFSARAYGWRCVLSSVRPKNQYGQNYQGIGFGELAEYKNKLINQYGLLEERLKLFAENSILNLKITIALRLDQLPWKENLFHNQPRKEIL